MPATGRTTSRAERVNSGRHGHQPLTATGLRTRFRHDGTGFVPNSLASGVDERPPMGTVDEYRSRLTVGPM
jgi:glucosyl-3-phosphoglycerate synthase